VTFAKNQRPIRFLHIPKTAGTSLNVFLDKFYSPSSIFVFKHTDSLPESLEKFRAKDPGTRDGIRLFRGHAPLITGNPEIDAARVFTLLRDPVKRVRSFCSSIHDGKYLPPELNSREEFDLDGFLDSGMSQLENLQTRMMVGEETYATLRASADQRALRQSLSAAFARIEFVGLQEHYEESLLLATLIFGWPPTSTGKKLNTRDEGRKLHFSEKNLRRIGELNAMDIEAHRMAGEIYAQTREKFGRRLAWLRLRLGLNDLVTSAQARIRSARRAS